MVNFRSILPPISLKIVTLCLLWYSISSISSQITKQILNEFPYPIALGEIQFSIVSIYSLFTIILLTNPIRHNNKKFTNYIYKNLPNGIIPNVTNKSSILEIITPNKHLFITVLPLGCFQFLGKLFSHSATALVPVSTVAGIKTLSPLLLVLTYRIIYNVRFPFWTYVSLIPLIFGILLIVIADSKGTLDAVKLETKLAVESSSLTSSHNLGIFYAFLSLVVFVCQNIYGKTVFTYNRKLVNNHQALALNNDSFSSTGLNDHSTNDYNSNNDSILPIFIKENDKQEESFNQNFSNSNHIEVNEKNVSYGKSYMIISNSPKIRNRYDKLTLLLFCSLIGWIISFPWFLYYESSNIRSSYFKSISLNNSEIVQQLNLIIPWKLLFLNGTSHFLQSLIAFYLLGEMPTVSYSIASMMKKIIIIIVSMVYTRQSITLVQFLGISFTTIGLYTYDRWGGKS